MKVGDVVNIKSGGPSMTVVKKLETCELCMCIWFKERELMQDVFPLESLVLCDVVKE